MAVSGPQNSAGRSLPDGKVLMSSSLDDPFGKRSGADWVQAMTNLERPVFKEMKKSSNLMSWFIWLLGIRLLIARVAGGKATFFRESWYRQAQVSPLTPPGWVFAAMWPVNYATSSMAAAIFAAKAFGEPRRGGLLLWFLQATVTSIWTRIFGDLKRPDYALASLLLSWLLAVETAKTFRKASPAGLWMMPLCLWLTLAMELNTEFILRNRVRNAAKLI